MVKENYSAKHTGASQDYKAAYDIVATLHSSPSADYCPDNLKVFRKYIYDLALKQNIEVATRIAADKKTLRITKLHSH